MMADLENKNMLQCTMKDYVLYHIQSDQKVSVHLMITIQLLGAQRLSDHSVYVYIYTHTHTHTYTHIYIHTHIYIYITFVRVISTSQL
jgi:hypothetical protein